jgi:hypothetical protein
MSEWWTYTLQDFLMFSPRTYFRMFELYNTAIWPAQVAAFLLGLALLLPLRRPTPTGSRAVCAALSACWLWVAFAFHIHRYAGIFTAAVYVGAAFALEATLLLIEGVLAGRLLFDPGSVAARRAGLGIFLLGLVVYPFIGPILGRPWRQTQVFGVSPDPTAIATLGLLLLIQGRVRWELAIIPTLWCALSTATLAAMKAPDAWVLIAAAGAALALMLWQALRRRR